MKKQKLTVAGVFNKLAEAGKPIRPAQVELAEQINQALQGGYPYVAEAPTGTGKTLAYLIGALVAQQYTKQPVVVATATVALQEQVLGSDLPALASLGVLQSFALAKGKARYFCPEQAQKLVATIDTSKAQQDMFASAEENGEYAELMALQQLTKEFKAGQWSGDLETLPTERPIFWGSVNASTASETNCKKSRCPSFKVCPFFQARAELNGAQVIVANQDIVLADLQQQKAEGDTVLHHKAYHLVVDEAHHFPAKSLSQSKAEVNLQKLSGLLTHTSYAFNQLLQFAKHARTITRQDIDTRAIAVKLADATAFALGSFQLDENLCYRIKNKDWPAELRSACELSVSYCEKFAKKIDKLSKVQVQSEKEGKVVADLLLCKTQLVEAGKQLARLLTTKAGVPLARWATVDEVRGVLELTLNLAEIDSGAVLKELLHSNENISPVFVSATLKGVGKFQPFLNDIGLGKGTTTQVFPYVLPYQNSKLVLPMLKTSPKDTGHQAELLATLPGFIKTGEANLVLVNSFAQAEALQQELARVFGQEAVLYQEAYSSVQAMLVVHKARVDAGQTSILVGLEKMGEGLDLPGKYLTNLLITRLPFDPPTDPIEAARQELIQARGGNYFADYALPKATTKLVQKVGRLVRTMQDQGTVVILDTRLQGSRWGQEMLAALPPFKRQTIFPK